MKLVIFDLDGVLVKTEHHHTIAFQQAIQKFAPHAAHASYLNAHDGIRTRDKLAMLKHDYSIDDATIQAIDAFKQHLTSQLLSKIAVNPDLQSAMQDLKKRGYKLAVASNTRRVYLNIIVRSLGIADLLDCTVAGDEVLHGKPHPECFIKAMAALNVDPLHAIVFEDSDAGKQAARASGATLIEVDPTTLITINQIANII